MRLSQGVCVPCSKIEAKKAVHASAFFFLDHMALVQGRRVDHVRAGSTPDEAYIAHDYVPKLVALHPRVSQRHGGGRGS